MAGNSPLLALDRYYKRLGRRGRMVLFQLPLSTTILLVVIATAISSPDSLEDARFQATLVLHLALLALCALVPWDRLPADAFAVIPVLDCVAIGLSREAAGPVFNLSLLLVFPVVWLASSSKRRHVVLAVAATVASAVVGPLVVGAELYVVRVVLLLAVFAGIAVSAHVLAAMLARQQQALEAKDRELQRMLSESQQRQQLLDTVVETVGVGVWVVDADGNNVLTNAELQAELDRSGADSIESTEIPPVFERDGVTELPPERIPLRRAAAGESFAEELIWVDIGEGRRAYSTSARAIQSEDGTFTGSVIAFTDVTALVTALTAKDDFVSTVSHELRTPLTSILGYLELILEDADPSDSMEELRIIQRNARRLLNLVNDLLAVAQDSLDIAVRDGDFADIVENAVDSARPRAAANRVELLLDASGPLPARLDPARVAQVIDNLLSNAIKYSPNGGIVTVRAHSVGTELVCSVSDTGLGMNEEEQAQAFTKFFRAARARDTAIPGAGLGLPISKTIVESHGGSISIASELGQGTTVTFTIPTVASAVSPQAGGPTAGVPTPAVSTSGVSPQAGVSTADVTPSGSTASGS